MAHRLLARNGGRRTEDKVYEALLGCMPGLGMAAVLADLRSERFVYACPGIADVLGWTPEEVLRMPSMWEIVAPGERRCVRERRRLRKAGFHSPTVYPTLALHRDDGAVPAEFSVTEVDHNGGPHVLVAIRRTGV